MTRIRSSIQELLHNGFRCLISDRCRGRISNIESGTYLTIYLWWQAYNASTSGNVFWDLTNENINYKGSPNYMLLPTSTIAINIYSNIVSSD